MTRFILLIALLLGFASVGYAVEFLRWERLPLSVRLFVGQERVIFVDRNVRVGMPESLSDRLRVQSAGGALYLKATAPIASTRLQLQDAISGALILVDVVAEEASADAAPLEPIRIVDSETAQDRNRGRVVRADANPQRSADSGSVATPIPVVLTRYAAQSFYAPLRTIEAVPGLVRVPTPRNLTLETLLPTLPVRAKAMAAWRFGDHWVTAIRISNAQQRWLTLDPRALQGDFLAATFQHTDVGPVGNPMDTTMLYLITRGHGLADALLPSIARIDAAVNLPSPAPMKEGDAREE